MGCATIYSHINAHIVALTSLSTGPPLCDELCLHLTLSQRWLPALLSRSLGLKIVWKLWISGVKPHYFAPCDEPSSPNAVFASAQRRVPLKADLATFTGYRAATRF